MENFKIYKKKREQDVSLILPPTQQLSTHSQSCFINLSIHIHYLQDYSGASPRTQYYFICKYFSIYLKGKYSL